MFYDGDGYGGQRFFMMAPVFADDLLSNNVLWFTNGAELDMDGSDGIADPGGREQSWMLLMMVMVVLIIENR